MSVKLASLTVVMRDSASLAAAFSAFSALQTGTGLLPTVGGWSPRALAPSASLPSAVSAGIPLSRRGPVLELLSCDDLPLSWTDRATRPRLTSWLAGVNLVTSPSPDRALSGLSLAALTARIVPHRRVRDALGLFGYSSVLPGVEAAGPCVTVDGAAAVLPRDISAAASAAPPDDAGDDGERWSLKEVCVGVEGARLAEALALVEALQGRAHAVRDPRALSAWRLRACGSTLRFLPSRYSALVLYAHDLDAAARDIAGAGVFDVARYGQTGGGEGELLLSSPLISGLDLRVCALKSTRPFFNETRDVYSEDVDPSLNPSEGTGADINCRGVAGMDVLSTVKMRVFGRVG